MPNPFSLTFGKSPLEMIPRVVQQQEITDMFSSELINQQVYIITGLRGTGKTVLLNDIAKYYRNEKGWEVIELNSERDLLQSLASKLYGIKGVKDTFVKAKVDISALGIGVSAENTFQYGDIESAIAQMLDVIKSKKKRLLITIDEVVNSKNMRIFASAFQILVRQDYPVFLLMTGLLQNITNLQDEKSLTFLYRAPKIQLGPLNISAIKEKYKQVFDLEDEEALNLARYTKGYPFAFQVLGYMYWNNPSIDDIVMDYKLYLYDMVYDKIWSELSKKDKKVCVAIAASETGRIKEVRDKLNMTSNEFNPYNDRLKKKEILLKSERGYCEFVLPFFKEYVLGRE
jgi:hypothetical protein